MLRRLHSEQPESFEFAPANLAWAQNQISKYPEGRQASAIIPLLWRAQEQEGWLTRPAIEYVADMLGMAYIRALEVASFYFMFQLQPVGSVAHIQICGTTSCMICGAEDLIKVCREKIADKPHALSADGKFSWEEVECLGACTNAPMAQIGKDYYEDLTEEKLAQMLDDMAAGKVPQVGPQNGRFASEPKSGISSLTDFVNGAIKLNASAQLADEFGDTIKRIDGTEVPLVQGWEDQSNGGAAKATGVAANDDKAPAAKPEAAEEAPAKPEKAEDTTNVSDEIEVSDEDKPAALEAARNDQPDDLKKIKGVGPKLEKLLNSMGFFHFDQVAAWTDKELAWVDQNLEGFKGRATRDEWVAQAKTLASGEES
ncbi:NADH-quinone oxidoreductase subunit E [Tropicibacter sp. R15_0]|uniref:NADH-quinone oxidoreductase subunit E n=1 Tax=Tropicibacter sp. R15_0 TaxID=2821101 RepID=UPI001ADC7A81|nr:NADH-quinone oxidoreductase subunit E [Tropicibacter sp. R15_0]MBO9464461.1 NADH-quinone oxidoreductase subunit E [Tropicibacter sp. R15_0]